MFAQRRRQRARIQDRLAGAVGAARHHRMRGIAEQRHPAKAPARQRILIDHREFQHAVGGANEGRHVEPVEMPVGEGADEIVERTGPVPVALAIVRRFDFGDPVDELQPVRVHGADRIDHHLAMRQPAGAHHAGARQHRPPARHAAPHVDAGIARLALVRKKLLADRGIDAVAGDRHTAAHGGTVSASRTVGKRHGDAGLVLFDTEAMPAGEQPVAAGARDESIQQHPSAGRRDESRIADDRSPPRGRAAPDRSAGRSD